MRNETKTSKQKAPILGENEIENFSRLCFGPELNTNNRLRSQEYKLAKNNIRDTLLKIASNIETIQNKNHCGRKEQPTAGSSKVLEEVGLVV